MAVVIMLIASIQVACPTIGPKTLDHAATRPALAEAVAPRVTSAAGPTAAMREAAGAIDIGDLSGGAAVLAVPIGTEANRGADFCDAAWPMVLLC
jgi:hypothetical protein